MPQEQEFSFLDGVAPLSQQGKPPITLPSRPEAKPSTQFSFLDEIRPLGAEPEEKPGILEKVKGLVGGITGAVGEGISDVKEKFFKKETEEEKRLRGTPKQPTMAAMTPKEKATFEKGVVPIPPRRFPKAEDLEYGKLEKLLDVPGQFLTNWVNMRAFGIPGLIHEKLTGEKLPGAKTPMGEVAGAGGSLYGLANFPIKGVAIGKGYAPFEVTRNLAQRVLGKPMKSVAGRLVQKAAENVATLGLGMGAVEWQGRDPVEVIQNKLRATGSGALTGLIFSGAEYANFAKLYPTMNHIMRFGIASSLLDIAHGTSPFDERTLFEKTFDYGLNWIFTKEGVSPKEYKAFWSKLNKELFRFRNEAAEDGLQFVVPTGEALKNRITELAGDPSKWAEAPPAKAGPRGLPQPVGYEVTPGGTVMPPGMAEPARTLVQLREQEIRPEERATSTVNIKPREDGSIDVQIVRQPQAPPPAREGQPTVPLPEAGGYPRGFNAQGEVRVKDYYRFFFGNQALIDQGWIIDYNPETQIAKIIRKGAPAEGVLTEEGRDVYRSTAFTKVPEPKAIPWEEGLAGNTGSRLRRAIGNLRAEAAIEKIIRESKGPEDALVKLRQSYPKADEELLQSDIAFLREYFKARLAGTETRKLGDFRPTEQVRTMPAEEQAEFNAIAERARERREAARDESIKGLRPAETDWMTAEELDRFTELQAKLPAISQKEAAKRVAEKRAERVKAAGKKQLSEIPLIGWLRKQGGIKPSSLEAAGMGRGEIEELAESKQKYVLNEKNGNSIVKLAQDAQQEGFIKEPNVSDLLEAIADELHGTPRPRAADADAYFEQRSAREAEYYYEQMGREMEESAKKQEIKEEPEQGWPEIRKARIEAEKATEILKSPRPWAEPEFSKADYRVQGRVRTGLSPEQKARWHDEMMAELRQWRVFDPDIKKDISLEAGIKRRKVNVDANMGQPINEDLIMGMAQDFEALEVSPYRKAAEPEIEYEAAPRKPTVAIKDKKSGKVYAGTPGETTHAEMSLRLQRKGIGFDDMIPGWVTPEGKWTESLREAGKSLEEPKPKYSKEQIEEWNKGLGKFFPEPKAEEEPWRESLIDYFDRRTKGPMALGPFEAKSIHRESVERALSEGKPVSPEVLKDYPELAKPEPEFKLTQEEEAKPTPKPERPKAEEPKLFGEEAPERAFPAGFDNRGIKSYPDINVAREGVQKLADAGWNLEFGQTPGGEAAWARLTSRQPEGRGSLKYVGLKVKPEFLKRPEWQGEIGEKPPLEVKEEAKTKAREEVEKQTEPKEISDAIEENRAERPEVKELDDRLDEIEKEVEKALAEGKLNRDLTIEEKQALQAKGKYEEGKPAPRKSAPMPEAEPEKPSGKQRLVRVSVKIPTGTTEEIGELPVERIEGLQKYAKKLGVEGDLVIGKEFVGKWGESLAPKDIEAVVKETLRDVKRKPKEWWEQWEEKAEKTREVWAGLPPPEFAKRAARWFIDALQIEPQFKRIGAPETGLALKRYHPIRNAEMERGLDSIASLRKKHKGLKLSKEEWQELTFIAASEKRFDDLTPEQRTRYGEVIKDIRKFFDDYAKREKDLGILVEEWPKSALRRLIAERDHYKQALIKLKNDTPRRQKVLKSLKEINETISWINEARPQYVHIPKTWLEKFWLKNAEKAPKLITEFFHERKTFDIEELAKYLLKHHVISPNDLDIRGIMALYGHKAGHKIALAEIFRNAEKEGLIRDIDKAPNSWQSLPGHKFPTLRGKRVNPVFVDFFEKNFIKRGFSPPTMGKILGTVKMLQFYNPAFLPMYDVFQAWWTGSVRSPKTPQYIKRAFGSMRNKDDAYWDAHYWGAFSTPFTPNFDTYAKQVDRAVKGHSFIRRAGDFISVYPLSWKAAWWGDNFIRMITYHHYIEKGESPRDAAQLTAKAHADYASIPPSTRKFLNKWFFTPSFKISMMAAQSEMIKNSAKYIFGGKEGRAKMTRTDKGMAKMITGLVTGMALREVTLHALGFKTDQYGLKYVKKVVDENGEEKELVLHTANPDNVFLRFFHRFKSLPMEPNKFIGFIDRAKWELHPLWQLGMEIMSNKGFSMEPVYDVFDNPENIVKDITSYSAKRVIRVLELLPGEEEKGRGKIAYKALIGDLGTLGQILSLFALPYLRNTPEVRLQYKIQNLIQQFKNLERDKPATSEEEAEQRWNNLDKHLKKIYDQLEEQ